MTLERRGRKGGRSEGGEGGWQPHTAHSIALIPSIRILSSSRVEFYLPSSLAFNILLFRTWLRLTTITTFTINFHRPGGPLLQLHPSTPLVPPTPTSRFVYYYTTFTNLFSTSISVCVSSYLFPNPNPFPISPPGTYWRKACDHIMTLDGVKW